MNSVRAGVTVLLCLLALAGCKTTSTTPSTPQPPAASLPSASSSTARGSSSGSSAPTAGSASAEPGGASGAPERRDAGGATESGATPPPPAAAAGATAPDPAAQDPAATSGGGTPEITLEDSERRAEAGSTPASEEQDVLDAALEAMRERQREAAAQSTPAPGAGATAGASASEGTTDATAGGNGASPTELARLDRELDTSLERFDGTLAGERARTLERAEDSGAGRDGIDAAGAAEADAGYGAPDHGTTRAADPAEAGGSGESATMAGATPAGRTAGGAAGRDTAGGIQQASAPIPPDIPDGSADDVVARQIREAAMKEKDPELRAKLWDEYRKYTGLTTGKNR